MRFTVLFLSALIGVVAWLTHEPVRDELSGPIEAFTGAAVGVAEASPGPTRYLTAATESHDGDMNDE